MKSKSLDCSRSASDSPSISGRDPSTHEMHSANAMPAQSCCHTALTEESTARRFVRSRELLFLPDEKRGIPSFQVTPAGNRQGLCSSEPELRNSPGKTTPGSHGQFNSTLHRSPSQPQRSSRPIMVSIGHLIGRKKPPFCQKWRQVKAVRAIWRTLPLEKEGQWAWTKLVIRTVV